VPPPTPLQTMVFNFRLLLRLVYKSLFCTRGTNARLTPKRLTVMLFLYPAYVLLETVHWLCFLLDDIFFSEYRSVDVKAPVFIVGAPRSGTTLLHRLLAGDEDTFTSMKMWEIFFAPSIVQKKVCIALGSLDNKLGNPVKNRIKSLEKRCFDHLAHMHHTSLFQPEEDELLLFHIFSTSLLFVVFPFADELGHFTRFDESLPAACRKRIMAFYKQCVQRHLFVFGRHKRFLSKNPSFTPKLQSLAETFPDANIIWLLRTPLEVVPSAVNLSAHFQNVYTTPREPYPLSTFVYTSIRHWYHYAASRLAEWKGGRIRAVYYTRLTRHPDHTLHDLYTTFGIEMNRQFQAMLQFEAKKVRRYKSRHSYCLEDTGFSHDRIVSDFRDIFSRFGFAAGESFTTMDYKN